MADVLQQLLSGGVAPKPPTALQQLFGFKIRPSLYPGEDDFFRGNPHVAGMAAETGDIILNPYSPPGINKDAVAKNEALRLYMRQNNLTPSFDVTDEQRKAFQGTSYGSNDDALKQTLAARIYSGDPSARATDLQRSWVDSLVGGFNP